MEGHRVDVQPLNGLLHGQFLQTSDLCLASAPLSGSSFHIGEQGGQESAASTGQVHRLVFPPHLRVGPVRIAAGVQGEPCGNGGGNGAGEEGAVAGLVAHNLVEQRASVVCAHVGVRLGNALCLGSDVVKGTFQTGQLARVLNGLDGVRVPVLGPGRKSRLLI